MDAPSPAGTQRVVAVYPERVARQVAPMALSPSRAVQMVEDVRRLADAAATASPRGVLVASRPAPAAPVEVTPVEVTPAAVVSPVVEHAPPATVPGKRGFFARLFRRRRAAASVASPTAPSSPSAAVPAVAPVAASRARPCRSCGDAERDAHGACRLGHRP